MYRILNYLFGWDYVVLISPTMDCRYILRVHRNKAAGCYVLFCGATFLNDNGLADNGYRWKALTF